MPGVITIPNSDLKHITQISYYCIYVIEPGQSAEEVFDMKPPIFPSDSPQRATYLQHQYEYWDYESRPTSWLGTGVELKQCLCFSCAEYLEQEKKEDEAVTERRKRFPRVHILLLNVLDNSQVGFTYALQDIMKGYYWYSFLISVKQECRERAHELGENADDITVEKLVLSFDRELKHVLPAPTSFKESPSFSLVDVSTHVRVHTTCMSAIVIPVP